MPRKVLALTLIPCLLWIQAAALGHCPHSDQNSAGRPHFQWNLLPAHHHEHVHSDDPDADCDHCHDHGLWACSHTTQDHDSDAVYLSPTSVLAIRESSKHLNSQALLFQFVQIIEAFGFSEPSVCIRHERPPELIHASCPLFLAHCSLQI